MSVLTTGNMHIQTINTVVETIIRGAFKKYASSYKV